MLLGLLSHYFFGITIFLTSVFLVLLVLVQRGRGGGLVGALGGPGGQSALGTKAGDVFTRITIVAAAIWIFLCAAAVRTLNPSSSGGPASLQGITTTSVEAGPGSSGAAAPAGAAGSSAAGTTPAGDAAQTPSATVAPAATTPAATTPAATTPAATTPAVESKPADTSATPPAAEAAAPVPPAAEPAPATSTPPAEPAATPPAEPTATPPAPPEASPPAAEPPK